MQTKQPKPGKPPADMVGPGRRVVTGVDLDGKSTILLDGPVPEHASPQWKGGSGHYLWKIPPGPPDLKDETDPLESLALKNWYPPPGAVAAFILTYEPGFQYPMHQSDTIDYIFVISGQMELVLENGSTVVGPGECVIQRGTMHSWRVVGDEPCTFCCAMVGIARDSE